MSDDHIRAAQYVRMSTEHQQYSTENQADVIREYASKRGMEIVRTFSDAGKSGLRIDGRDALKELIDVVQSGSADFKTILVYDVSRWGRFQDADESAYYEYICKRAGITVHYCAEQFENDGSPVSTIVKSVKRAMAGEYSRELSAKVFKGQCRLIELGFRQGGPAGYGLRRMLIDQAGKPKAELQPGEQKSLQTDRVVLVPGPTEELAVVRRIYRLFVHEAQHRGRDRRRAQRRRARRRAGRAVDARHRPPGPHQREVHRQQRLQPHLVQAEEEARSEPAGDVGAPRRRLRGRSSTPRTSPRPGDHPRAAPVRSRTTRCWSSSRISPSRHGRLSGLLIDETDGMPSSAVYRHRFGSLVRAYQLIGYDADRDLAFIEINRRLRANPPRASSTMPYDRSRRTAES